MINKNNPNLKPWKKGQSGNPAGRKVGSKNLEKQIKELRAELTDPDLELLSIEQFLNLVVDEEKVVSYQMTKAFSKLEKAQNVLNGRGDRI